MDPLIGSLASLGIGGIIAGIVLVWKRQDDKERLEEHKTFADTLETMSAQIMKTVSDNTASNIELKNAITNWHDDLALDKRMANLESRVKGND